MKTRKFLAVLLSLAMTLSLLPVGVFATDDVTVGDIVIGLDGGVTAVNATKIYKGAADKVEAALEADSYEETPADLMDITDDPTVSSADSDLTLLAVAVGTDNKQKGEAAAKTLDLSSYTDVLNALGELTVTLSAAAENYKTNVSVADTTATYYAGLMEEPDDLFGMNDYTAVKGARNDSRFTKLEVNGSSTADIVADVDDTVAVFKYVEGELKAFAFEKVTTGMVNYNIALSGITLTGAGIDPADVEVDEDLANTGADLVTAEFDSTEIATLTGVGVTLTASTDEKDGAQIAYVWGDSTDNFEEAKALDYGTPAGSLVTLSSSDVHFAEDTSNVLFVKVTTSKDAGVAAYYKITASLGEAAAAITSATVKETSEGTPVTVPTGANNSAYSLDPKSPAAFGEAKVLVANPTSANLTVTLAGKFKQSPVQEDETGLYVTQIEWNTDGTDAYTTVASPAAAATTANIPLTVNTKATLYLKVTARQVTKGDSVGTPVVTYYSLPITLAASATTTLIESAKFGSEFFSATDLDIPAKASTDATKPTKVTVTLNDGEANEASMAKMTAAFEAASGVEFKAKLGTKDGSVTTGYEAIATSYLMGANSLYVEAAPTGGGLPQYYEFQLIWTPGANPNLATIAASEEDVEVTVAEATDDQLNPTNAANFISVPLSYTGGDNTTVILTAVRPEIKATNVTAAYATANADYATVNAALTGAGKINAGEGDGTITITANNFKNEAALYIKVTSESGSQYVIYKVTSSNGTAKLDDGATPREYMFAAESTIGEVGMISPDIALTLTGYAFAKQPGDELTLDEDYTLTGYEALGVTPTLTINTQNNSAKTKATLTFTGTTGAVNESKLAAVPLKLVLKADALTGTNTDVNVASNLTVSLFDAKLTTEASANVVKGQTFSKATTLTLRGGGITLAESKSGVTLSITDGFANDGVSINESQFSVTTSDNTSSATATVTGTALAKPTKTSATVTMTVKAASIVSDDSKFLVMPTDGITADGYLSLSTGDVTVTPATVYLVKDVTNNFDLTVNGSFEDNQDLHDNFTTSVPGEAAGKPTFEYQGSADESVEYTTIAGANTAATLKLKTSNASTAGTFAGQVEIKQAALTGAGAALTLAQPTFVVGEVTMADFNGAVLLGNNGTFDLVLTATGLSFNDSFTPEDYDKYDIKLDGTSYTTTKQGVLTVTGITPNPDGEAGTDDIRLTVKFNAAAAETAGITVANAAAISVVIDKSQFDDAPTDTTLSVTTTENASATLTIDELKIGSATVAPAQTVQVGKIVAFDSENDENNKYFTATLSELSFIANNDETLDAGERAAAFSTTDLASRNLEISGFAQTTTKSVNVYLVTNDASTVTGTTGDVTVAANKAVIDQSDLTLCVTGPSITPTANTFKLTVNPVGGMTAKFEVVEGTEPEQVESTTIASGAALKLNITNAFDNATGELITSADETNVLDLLADITPYDDTEETWNTEGKIENVVVVEDIGDGGVGAGVYSVTNLNGVGMDAVKAVIKTAGKYQIVFKLTAAGHAETVKAESNPVTLTVTHNVAKTMKVYLDGSTEALNLSNSVELINTDKVSVKPFTVKLFDENDNLVNDNEITVKATVGTDDWKLIKGSSVYTSVSDPAYITAGDPVDGEYTFSDYRVFNTTAADIGGASLTFLVVENGVLDTGDTLADHANGAVTAGEANKMTFTVPADASAATINLTTDTISAGSDLFVDIKNAKGYDGSDLTGNWVLVVTSNIAEDAYNNNGADNNSYNNKSDATTYGNITTYGIQPDTGYIVAVREVTISKLEQDVDGYGAKNVAIGNPITRTTKFNNDVSESIGSRTLRYALVQYDSEVTTKELQRIKTVTTTTATPTVNPDDPYAVVWSKTNPQANVKFNGYVNATTAVAFAADAKLLIVDQYGNQAANTTDGTTYQVKAVQKTADNNTAWEIYNDTDGTANRAVNATNGVVTFFNGDEISETTVLKLKNKSQNDQNGAVQFQLVYKNSGNGHYEGDPVVGVTAAETLQFTLGVGADSSALTAYLPAGTTTLTATADTTTDIIPVKGVKRGDGADVTGDGTATVHYTDDPQDPSTQGQGDIDATISVENGEGTISFTLPNEMKVAKTWYLTVTACSLITNTASGISYAQEVQDDEDTELQAIPLKITAGVPALAISSAPATTVDVNSGAKLGDITLTLKDKVDGVNNFSKLGYIVTATLVDADGDELDENAQLELTGNSTTRVTNSLGTVTFNNLTVVNHSNNEASFKIKFTATAPTEPDGVAAANPNEVMTEAYTITASRSGATAEITANHPLYATSEDGSIEIKFSGVKGEDGKTIKTQKDVTVTLTQKDKDALTFVFEDVQFGSDGATVTLNKDSKLKTGSNKITDATPGDWAIEVAIDGVSNVTLNPENATYKVDDYKTGKALESSTFQVNGEDATKTVDGRNYTIYVKEGETVNATLTVSERATIVWDGSEEPGFEPPTLTDLSVDTYKFRVKAENGDLSEVYTINVVAIEAVEVRDVTVKKTINGYTATATTTNPAGKEINLTVTEEGIIELGQNPAYIVTFAEKGTLTLTGAEQYADGKLVVDSVTANESVTYHYNAPVEITAVTVSFDGSEYTAVATAPYTARALALTATDSTVEVGDNRDYKVTIAGDVELTGAGKLAGEKLKVTGAALNGQSVNYAKDDAIVITNVTVSYNDGQYTATTDDTKVVTLGVNAAEGKITINNSTEAKVVFGKVELDSNSSLGDIVKVGENTENTVSFKRVITISEIKVNSGDGETFTATVTDPEDSGVYLDVTNNVITVSSVTDGIAKAVFATEQDGEDGVKVTGDLNPDLGTVDKNFGTANFVMFTFTEKGTTAAPKLVIDPDTGLITLQADNDAAIYFTTNGETPETTEKMEWNGEKIAFNENDDADIKEVTVIKAFAVEEGKKPSTVVTYEAPHFGACNLTEKVDIDGELDALSIKINGYVDSAFYFGYQYQKNYDEGTATTRGGMALTFSETEMVVPTDLNRLEIMIFDKQVNMANVIEMSAHYIGVLKTADLKVSN